jgi:hypothetical protein
LLEALNQEGYLFQGFIHHSPNKRVRSLIDYTGGLSVRDTTAR